MLNNGLHNIIPHQPRNVDLTPWGLTVWFSTQSIFLCNNIHLINFSAIQWYIITHRCSNSSNGLAKSSLKLGYSWVLLSPGLTHSIAKPMALKYWICQLGKWIWRKFSSQFQISLVHFWWKFTHVISFQFSLPIWVLTRPEGTRNLLQMNYPREFKLFQFLERLLSFLWFRCWKFMVGLEIA